MSQFIPNLRTFEPPDAPDHLASALLQGLARPIGHRQSSRPFRAFFWGAISFGILPALTWPLWFDRFANLEQEQLWHLAEWVRLHRNHPEAARLCAAAEGLLPRRRPRVLGVLIIGIMASLFATCAWGTASWADVIWGSTYGYAWMGKVPWDGSGGSSLFLAWFIGLSVIYASHWLRLQRHAARIRYYLSCFNAIAKSEGLAPVAPIPTGLGLEPEWLVAAAVLCAAGAFWALPMMMAGAAQRRYIRVISLRDRAALAHRLRAMLLRERPAPHVPVPVFLRRACPRPLCRAAAREGALFCPRCGVRLPEKVLQNVA